MAWVTVDRPEARNALTAAMYFGIRYAVDRVNGDDSLDGLVITGSGDVFIPGGNLGGATPDTWMDFGLLRMDVTPFDAIMQSPKPVVSAVNGICQGGGLMIALLSDVVVAGTNATFRAPELLRGIADMNFASILPTQIGPGRARDLLLTGRTIDATEAERWGLVTRVVDPDELLPAAERAMEECRQMAPQARAAVKRGINACYPRYDRMSMDLSLAGPEVAEGFRAFKARERPAWARHTDDE
ncbi:MAG TPA: enoyl-CoA hydratase/isomerase family protein [Acidimicrobiales bacterium]|nr:enoyl-CoA hydratase/isomerase family protein [Acidimicrobiales bacterium]